MKATDTYRNSFFKVKETPYRKEFYPVDPDKVEYKGYEIHQATVQEFHVVIDGVCISMRAGLDGAKRSIDARLGI